MACDGHRHDAFKHSLARLLRLIAGSHPCMVHFSRWCEQAETRLHAPTHAGSTRPE